MGELESELFKLNLFKNLDNFDFSKAPDHSSVNKDDESNKSNEDSDCSQQSPYLYTRQINNKDMRKSNDKLENSQEGGRTNNQQRSQSANKERINVIQFKKKKKSASKEMIYITPQKRQSDNMNQNYMNNSSKLQDSSISYGVRNAMMKTTQSNYIQSNAKEDKQNSFKKNNESTNGQSLFANNKMVSYNHFGEDNHNQSGHDDGDEDDYNNDQYMQRKRNFEQNMEMKRSLLEREFDQEEDRRRAQLKQQKDSQMKSQVIYIIQAYLFFIYHEDQVIKINFLKIFKSLSIFCNLSILNIQQLSFIVPPKLFTQPLVTLFLYFIEPHSVHHQFTKKNHYNFMNIDDSYIY